MKLCPVCGHSHKKIKYRLKFIVYQCTNCGAESCPDANLNKLFISDLDEQKREKALKKLRKENFSKIISSFCSLLPDNPSGLEVGCSYGWFLEACAENNMKCTGIEPEIRFNDIYREKGFDVKNGFFPDILMADEKYDFIIFNDVIEHIKDIESTMRANYLALNDNGILILNIPVQEGLIYTISKFLYYLGIKDLMNRMWQFNFHSPHLYYFKRKNIKDLSSNHHFKLKNSFKLRTILISGISSRIKEDQKLNIIKHYIIYIGVLILFPLLNMFPDTYCFVFQKKPIDR